MTDEYEQYRQAKAEIDEVPLSRHEWRLMRESISMSDSNDKDTREPIKTTCDNCKRKWDWNPPRLPEGKAFDPPDLCPSCAEAKALSNLEAPEGGWRRNSDLDRL